MAREKTTTTLKMDPAEIAEPAEKRSQVKRTPEGRYQLQIDRQTKRYYATSEEAVEAGRVIKKAHPIVQVAVYDSISFNNEIIELTPAA